MSPFSDILAERNPSTPDIASSLKHITAKRAGRPPNGDTLEVIQPNQNRSPLGAVRNGESVGKIYADLAMTVTAI
jgi:hypothetical protein